MIGIGDQNRRLGSGIGDWGMGIDDWDWPLVIGDKD